MPVGDGSELVWTEGGCAPKEYEIPQQPSEIPNITVIGQRIPRIPIRISLPPLLNPLRVIPPPIVLAPHPLLTPRKLTARCGQQNSFAESNAGGMDVGGQTP